MKYRKKPVIIEAVQWRGDHFSLNQIADLGCAFLEHENGYDLEIETLEGVMIARIDDFIIKGVKGEFYPCKPDIFKMTYEAVE